MSSIDDAMMSAATLIRDRRQSDAALEIARGTVRILSAHGLVCVPELSLGNGRRADLMALCPRGDVTIVEVKSSVSDFRSDHKWPDYHHYCDRFYFAVAPSFPADMLPGEPGIIVADRYGGEIAREPPVSRISRLQAARRKAITLAFARCAAARLTAAWDPAWRRGELGVDC